MIVEQYKRRVKSYARSISLSCSDPAITEKDLEQELTILLLHSWAKFVSRYGVDAPNTSFYGYFARAVSNFRADFFEKQARHCQPETELRSVRVSTVSFAENQFSQSDGQLLSDYVSKDLRPLVLQLNTAPVMPDGRVAFQARHADVQRFKRQVADWLDVKAPK